MGKSKSKGVGRSFDSVPADDGFRNYMSRKIELQRKQFGLVLPPPPSPPVEASPNTFENFHQEQAADDDSGVNQLQEHNARLGSDSLSCKSVRFHANLERVDPITSVSDILEHLKQRHSVKRSSLRRRRYGNKERFTYKSTGRDPSETSTTSSIDVGPQTAQRRDSRTSSKRKRPLKSVLETLDWVDKSKAIDNGNQAVQVESNVLEKDYKIVQTAAAPPISQNVHIDSLGAGNLSSINPRTEACDSITSQNTSDYDEYDTTVSGNKLESKFGANSHKSAIKSHEQLREHQNAETGDNHNPLKAAAEVSMKEQTRAGICKVQNGNVRPELFFAGVVVLINGHTNPDATTLMRLLHKHGGDLEKYETRRVTHIIAERLSTAKANIYKNKKNPTPVCRPEWITESVSKGKLLPFGDYLLHDVLDKIIPGTKSLKSFFVPEKGIEQVPEANCWTDGQLRTVGNDPTFLESYFSSSRLSYIGSFKQRIKSTEGATIRKPKVPGSTRVVFLVDMDCFFASVSLKNFPQCRNCPIAIGHTPTVDLKSTQGTHSKLPSPSKTLNNSWSELSTCNYIARKFGVKKGMFLSDAIKICPQLVVLPYDFPQYEIVSGIVADKLHDFVEQFNGYVEQVSCDESYLEIFISPQDHVNQTMDSFLQTLADDIRSVIFKATECTASIGVACNKFLAKLAADKVKPDASKVVTDYQSLLDGISLRDLHGIGRKIEKKLKAHDLCTVNDIWDLADEAESIVGDVVGTATSQKIVQYCYGKDDRPVMPQVRKTIGAECNYGVRFEGPFGPDHMIKGLAKEVEKRMSSVNVYGSKLTLKLMKSRDPSKIPGKFLGHGICEHLSRSLEMPTTRSCSVIYSYGLKLFEKMGINKEFIRGMGLVVSCLETDAKITNGSSPSKLDAWLKSNFTGDTDHEVGDINRSLMDQSDGVSIPTYSQIDQDVLTELPDHIREELQSMYGKATDHLSRATNKPAVQSSSNRSKKDKRQETVPGQVSVKRMLKLACVKSGEEKLECANKDFTLSQLDCLPLETQLQIANNDNVVLSKYAVLPKTGAIVNKIQSIKGCPESHLDSGVTIEQTINSTTLHDMFCSSRNFYDENIRPLQEFIRSRPSPDNDDVQCVIEFLSICIAESRVDDVIVFLRTIKTMRSGWDKTIYDLIKKSVVDKALRLNGYMLDTTWFGL